MPPGNNIENVLAALKDGWRFESATVSDFMHSWREKLNTQTWIVETDTNWVRFETEISTIRLRGMGIVPVLAVGGDGPAVESAIVKFKHDVWSSRQFSVVLCLSDSSYAKAGGLLPAGRGLLITASDAVHLFRTPDPVGFLRKKILTQIPYQRLMPYSITQTAEGVMFFGRKSEQAIMQYEDHVDFVIWGKGRIGKSSLLDHVRWLLRRQMDVRLSRRIEVSLYNCELDHDSAARRIAQAVGHTSFAEELMAKGLVAFLKRIKATDARFKDGPIDLVMDEVDDVFAFDAMTESRLLRALREARELKLLRLTFCGRDTAKEILSVKEEFAGRTKPIELMALNPNEAMDLLRFPLRDLGLSIRDEDRLLDHVLARSGCEPKRVQEWGMEIANLAGARQDRSVSANDLPILESRFAA